MRQRQRTLPPLLWPILLGALFACDIAGTGGSPGCLRIHQGDYAFPVKRIVEGGVSL